MEFCTVKQTHVPLIFAKFHVKFGKFHVKFGNESSLRGEKADFRSVSKFNTGSLPLCGNPVGNKGKEWPSGDVVSLHVKGLGSVPSGRRKRSNGFFLFKNISRITSSCDRICMHLLTYVCILSYNICSKTGPSIL